MSTELITSKKYTVNWRDIIQGALIAAGTPVILMIQESLDMGVFTFHWKELAMAAVGGLVAYLTKKFFTPSQTIVKITPAVTDGTTDTNKQL